jgi:hypothetical protein
MSIRDLLTCGYIYMVKKSHLFLYVNTMLEVLAALTPGKGFPIITEQSAV